jgi:hypothetical protein
MIYKNLSAVVVSERILSKDKGAKLFTQILTRRETYRQRYVERKK